MKKILILSFVVLNFLNLNAQTTNKTTFGFKGGYNKSIDLLSNKKRLGITPEFFYWLRTGQLNIFNKFLYHLITKTY